MPPSDNNNTDPNEHDSKKFIRDKEGKKKLIIDTFLRLVDERGYANVSTNLIAKEAKISVGTIYNYFQDKGDILLQTFNHSTESFSGATDYIDLVFHRNLVYIKHFIHGFLEEHRKFYAINQAIDQAFVLNQKVFHEFQNNVEMTIRQFVEEAGKNDQRLDNIQPDTLIQAFLVILSFIDNFVHQYLFRQSIFKTDSELVDYLSHIFVCTLDFYIPME